MTNIEEWYLTESIIERLQEAFRGGTLARNDYWKAIQNHHLLVAQYTALIQGDILDHIEIHRDELRVVLKNGLHFVWNPHEIRTATSVLVNNGEYENAELYTLLRLAKDCTNIVDVGANIGWYTLHLAQAVQPKGGVVWAFEPIPYTYDALLHNIDLNPAFRNTIKTYNVALGETPGTVEFYIPAFQGSVAASQSTLYPDDENQVVQGQMVTLDTFAQQEGITNVDLFKCDVEGAELFVLRGGLKTIEQNTPIIMLEMLRKWSAKFGYHPNDMIRLLAGYGYGCWYAENDHFHPLTHMDETIEAVNFFFLHEEKHSAIIQPWREGIALKAWVKT